MRRRNAHEPIGLSGARLCTHVSIKCGPQGSQLFRISGPGVHRIAFGSRREFTLPRFLHALENLILQKAAFAQRIDEMRRHITDLQIARELRQQRLHVEIGLLAVETLETLHEHRRDDQGHIRVTVGIANQKAGPVGHRRGHEIQISA